MELYEKINIGEEIAASRYEIALEELAKAIFQDEVEMKGEFLNGSYTSPVFKGSCKIYYPINLGSKPTFLDRFQKLNDEQIEEMDIYSMSMSMEDLDHAIREGKYEKTKLFKRLLKSYRKNLEDRLIVILGNCITNG